MKRSLFVLPLVLIAVVAGLWLNWQLASPSHDRDWREEYGRLPLVTRDDGVYRLKNIRNWDYAADGTPRRKSWVTATIDPQTVRDVWFLMEPFGEIDAIAHTMLAFEFEDGRAYVASIEARREADETYNAPKAAVLPVFEYMFVWTTERDMLGNSAFAAGDDVYMYRLALAPAQKRAVLQAMLDETAALAAAPRWYNTLFSNCTNVLARTVNRGSPGAVPFDKAWYLPGYADAFLYREGFIAGDGGFAALRSRALVTSSIARHYDVQDPARFSQALRADLLAR